MINSAQSNNQTSYIPNPLLNNNFNNIAPVVFNINKRQDISKVIQQTKKIKGAGLTLNIQMTSLPYPYFQQLLKFLKQLAKNQNIDAVSVNWNFDPKNYDVMDKGKLMESFCPEINFQLNKTTIQA